MDILQNPFHILGATTRDNRQRIMALAEEKSLNDGSENYIEARSELMNPRKRLSAEICWLPGVGPKRTAQAIALLESNPAKLRLVAKLPTLSKANLLSAAMVRLNGHQSGEECAKWILDLAHAHDEIDSENTLSIVNEERTVSGFSKISDINLVIEELLERRRHYKNSIKNALDKLSSKELVKAVTMAVDSATKNGQRHAFALIDDVVDSYEVETQGFLNKEAENITNIISLIKQTADSNQPEGKLSKLVSELEKTVQNWDFVAQPIQVSLMSRGIDHELSCQVAIEVRDLSLYLFNEHGKLELSQRITNLLEKVFAEVIKIAEISEKDSHELKQIAAEREKYIKKQKIEEEKWKQEILYETEIGTFFKDKLKISTEGIEWKGRLLPLDSITKVRWGGTMRSVNGISTGVSYTIGFGSKRGLTLIETKKKNIFMNFTDRLWKAVCVRLLIEMLNDLKNEKHYKFGSAIVTDSGIVLKKLKFIGKNEKIMCSWNELVIGNGAGTFYIAKKNNRKVSEELSYLEIDNVHILEAAIRMFWKKGGNKISSLLSSNEYNAKDDPTECNKGENENFWEDVEHSLDENLENDDEKKLVVIHETNNILGIEAEYRWIKKHYGERGKDWEVDVRFHGQQEDRYIETFIIKLKDGRKVSVDFDITSFFGKW
jgi:hypothetical protein